MLAAVEGSSYLVSRPIEGRYFTGSSAYTLKGCVRGCDGGLGGRVSTTYSLEVDEVLGGKWMLFWLKLIG